MVASALSTMAFMLSRITDAWRRPIFGAWSGEVGRKRPCHGEPIPIDLRFQLHQATHLEADHLGLLVAYDQQRGKPAQEGHVADERRLVLCLRSKPLRDRYHRVIGRETRSGLDARLPADLSHKQLRSLLCAQFSAVQAAADPDVSSPGSLSDTLHRRSTGIREGSLGILCFGRRLTVLHQVQVHVGHLRWFHHHPAEAPEKLDALVALGSRVRDDAGHPVLSARYHLFVRATEGAFVSFADDGPRIFLGRHEVDPDTGRAVFEFGTCNRCGAVHLAGEVEHRDRREYFVPTKKADASVNWLVLADANVEALVDEDEVTLGGDGDASANADPATRALCTGCGLLASAGATQCCTSHCRSGRMLSVREHRRATRIMTRCTECGTQSRQGIRRLRTDTNAAPAVVTTALYQQLPEATGEIADEVGAGRKLLMFSDSRQAAAFATYLDRTYARLLERRYMAQALQDPSTGGRGLTLGDLAILTRERAEAAGHFPRGFGAIETTQAINQWVMGELITLETRQSLEGLGLMTVTLQADPRVPLRGFIDLGLNEDEAWSLLNVLVKTARLQGAVSFLALIH